MFGVTVKDRIFYGELLNNKPFKGEVKFKNDSGIYKGYVNEKCIRNGYGEMIYSDGSSYIGEWVNDKKHGKGIFKSSTKKINGVWIADKLNGFVHEITYDNGVIFSTYIGNYVNNLKMGYGKITYTKQPYFIEFNGTWHGDKPKTGVLIDKENNVYHGSVLLTDKNVLIREGTGTYIVNDEQNKEYGTYYEGYYVNNVKNGKGQEIVFIQDKEVIEKYVGDFQDNFPFGKGKRTFTDGSYYEGDFHKGISHGKGKLMYKNGIIAEGIFRNGSLNGKGIMTKDNIIYEGEWLNGNKEGKGKITFPNGDFYSGEFKSNLREGIGWAFENNKVCYGMWKNDLFIKDYMPRISKAKKKLVPYERQTRWQEIAMNINKYKSELETQELKKYLRVIGYKDKDLKDMSFRKLCYLLALDYEKYIYRESTTNIHNPDSLSGFDWVDIQSFEIIKTDENYLFSLEDLRKLKSCINPYTKNVMYINKVHINNYIQEYLQSDLYRIPKYIHSFITNEKYDKIRTLELEFLDHINKPDIYFLYHTLEYFKNNPSVIDHCIYQISLIDDSKDYKISRIILENNISYEMFLRILIEYIKEVPQDIFITVKYYIKMIMEQISNTNCY